MTYRHKVQLFVVTLLACSAFILSMGVVSVKALGNSLLDPSDVSGFDQAVYLASADSNAVTTADIGGSDQRVGIYFATKPAANFTVQIQQADLCFYHSDRNPTAPNKNIIDYAWGRNDNPIAGRNVTQYAFFTSSGTLKTSVWGVVNASSTSCPTKAITISPTWLTLDSHTNMWSGFIDVNGVPRTAIGQPSGGSGYVNSFRLVAPAGSYLSFVQNRQFAIDAGGKMVPGDFGNVTLPFAVDCSVNPVGTIAPNKRLTLYDPDNGTTDVQVPKFWFTVEYSSDNGATWHLLKYSAGSTAANVVNAFNHLSPAPTTGTTAFYPTSSSGTTTWVSINMVAGQKYRWIQHNVFDNNTIQFSLPFDSIYSVTGCKEPQPSSWSLSGTTDLTEDANVANSAHSTGLPVVPDSINTGAPASGSFTFKHYVKNNGAAADTAGYSWRIEQRNDAGAWTVVSGASGSQAAQAGGVELLVKSLDVPIPAAATTQYCQRVSVSPQASGGAATWTPLTEACVKLVPVPVCLLNAVPSSSLLEPGDTTNIKIGYTGAGAATIPSVTYAAPGFNPSSGSVLLTNGIGSINNIQVPSTAGAYTISWTNGSVPCSSTINVYDLPTVMALGASARTGGDFDCSGSGVDNGLLESWYNSSAKYGSGTGLAAIAMIKIYGFASAHNNPNKPIGLSMANGTFVDDAHTATLGGDFGVTAYCFTNPDMSGATATGATTIDLSSMANGTYSSSGDVVIEDNGNQVPKGRSIAIKAKNIYIQHSIQYQTGWAARTDIPSVILEADGGNIYINNQATQIDGLFIAKEDASNNKGIIYTCANSQNTPETAANLYDNCKNRLVIHGSFVAKQINLMRTWGTLKDEPGGGSCTNGGARYPYPTGGNGTCAAEVFDFSPEMFIANPAVKKPANGTLLYDSIVNLPPVL